MSSLPINDLSSFSPQNDFLTGVIDQAADQTTKEITSETVPTEEKEAQRKEYIRLTSEMACLKGKGIVNTVLGELEGANTNLDFLNAMKRLEPLIARVRRRLTEAQILLPNRDAFAPLEFTQATTRKPVSPLQRLTAEKNTVANNAAVMFLNRILPLLGTKWDELQRGAYRTSEGVFREDHDFKGEDYGMRAVTSQETSLERRLWNGVSLPNRSEYAPKLLKLSQDSTYTNRLISFEELTKVLSDDPNTPINLLALKQGLIKIDNLFKEAGKPTPYKKIHGQGIRFDENVGDTPVSTEKVSDAYIPNAEFLSQPLVFSASATSVSPVLGDVTVDMVDTLGLSETAAKVLTYFIEHPDAMTKVSLLSESLNESAQFAVELPSLVQAINDSIAQHTRKRLIKTGNMIIFRIPE